MRLLNQMTWTFCGLFALACAGIMLGVSDVRQNGPPFLSLGMATGSILGQLSARRKR